jgi:nicotinamide-nucleotide amidase
MRTASIISIGNEILIGDTVNTNASWIGRLLTERGFQVSEVITIPDEFETIQTVISTAIDVHDFVAVTGGLGPTHDDVTKKALADLFDSELVLNEEVLAFIKKVFERRGFTFSKSNHEQAMVPGCCKVLFNKQGTAPGMLFERKGHFLVSMPGVPNEMKYIMENGVLPVLEEHFPGQDLLATRYMKTAGVPESVLSDDVIGDLNVYLDNGFSVAYLPHPGGVTLRCSCEGSTKESAEAELEKLTSYIYAKVKDYIYGEGRDCSLSEVLGNLLAERNLTIATAESCTGGALANRITDTPGCSRYMNGSVVAYSNELKVKLLDVNKNTLKAHGAVSLEVALEMARGVAEKTGSDIGISTTGIAGPDGGTPDKPVGTVWMGFWMPGNHFALCAQFTKDRLINKERTVMVSMETVRRVLLGISEMPYNLKKQFRG